MYFRVVAIVVFLFAVGGGLAVHFRQAAVENEEQKAHAGHAHRSEGEPEVPVPPKTGPFAKFVVDGEPIHMFGIMEHFQDGSHEFKIRNDGEAPLKMVALAKDHTCQCTLGSLGKDGLQPGESTTVKMTWKIKNPAALFEHSAKIRTNDPKSPVTSFIVRGLVGKRQAVTPSTEVIIGTLSEKDPTARMLSIHSEIVDSFQITKVETSSPLIVAEIKPLTAEQLEELSHDRQEEESRAMMEKMSKQASESAAKEGGDKTQEEKPQVAENPLIGKKPPAKCGHMIELKFQPGFAIGKFRETVTLHTDIPASSESGSAPLPPTVISIQGNRAGPLELFALGQGFAWTPELSLLSLGRFPAKSGKTVKLMVFASKADEDIKILEATLDPPNLKYSLVKDEKFQQPNRCKYTLTVEVPGDEVPVSFSGERRGSMSFQTNHPDAKTINFELDFTSF